MSWSLKRVRQWHLGNVLRNGHITNGSYLRDSGVLIKQNSLSTSVRLLKSAVSPSARLCLMPRILPPRLCSLALGPRKMVK